MNPALIRVTPLLALLACATVCPTGSALQDDGLCHLIEAADTAAPPDDGGSGATGWVPVPSTCANSADAVGADPLARVGGLSVQEGSLLAEVVDIDLSPDGQIAWMVGQGGIIGVDISNPTAPALYAAEEAREFGARFQRLEVAADGTLFLTNRDLGLWQAKLEGEDDGEELELEQQSDERGLSGMAIVGDSLFVGTLGGEVIRYALHGSSDPHEVARIGGLGNVWELVAVGDQLYVAGGAGGLSVLDIADGALTFLTSVATEGALLDLAASPDGGLLFGAEGGAGVSAFDLSTPADPQLLGRQPLLDSALSVSASEGRLWASTVQGVVVFDSADPQSPLRALAQEPSQQWAMHIVADGDRAYVADWGYFSAFALDATRTGPSLLLGSDLVYARPAGSQVELPIANLGSTPLDLHGACIADPRLRLEATGLRLAPGAAGALRLTLDAGDPLRDAVRLYTNDGDGPAQDITVVAEESGPGVALGNEAPDFTLPDLDGVSHQLSAQEGHPVVLVYFATW